MKYLLKLYVTGETPNSLEAIKNLKTICKENLRSHGYTIKIIDITKSPQLAEEEKIIATPTLVKKLPPPIQKIIGTLSNKEKVLFGMDLLKAEEK